MEWLTSSTMLRSLRSPGDDGAWELLVRRFREPVAAFARRMGVEADEAEDVAQETLTALAESLRSGRYDPARGRLSTWVFGIASRHALRARRRRARAPLRIRRTTDTTTFWSALPDPAPASGGWQQEWEQHLLATCLERARREVRPTTYRAFEMVVVEGVPAETAAAELGVAITAVYNAKHRVIRRVRELRAELETAEIADPRQRSTGQG